MAEAPEETGRRGSGGRLCFNAIARLHSWRPQHATDGEAPAACDSVRFLLLLLDCSIWTGPSASSPRGDGRRNLWRSLETLKMRSMLGGSCFLDPFTFILNVRGKPITMHLYANLCGTLITIYVFLYSYAACSHVRTLLFILFYFPLSSFQTAFALPLQSITTTPG